MKKEKIKICAVYRILCHKNGKSYIGGTTDISKRFAEHRNALIGRRHRCSQLQEAYNDFGLSEFSYYIIEKSNKKNIFKAEKRWFVKSGKENLFNQNGFPAQPKVWEENEEDKLPAAMFTLCGLPEG